MRSTFHALTCITLLTTLGAPVLARDIEISVVSLTPKPKKPGVISADVCSVVVQADNNTHDPINLEIAMRLQFVKGSMSAMVAPAGNSFGNKDTVIFGALPPMSKAQGKDSLLGVDCSEITSITIKPTCVITPGTMTCDAAVIRSPTSIIALLTETDDTPIGGPEIVAMPKGPLDGQWTITSKGQTLLTLDLVQPLDSGAKGTFATTRDICTATKQDAGCAQGQSAGNAAKFAKLRKGEVMILVDTGDDNADRLMVKWNAETGVGTLNDHNFNYKVNITATNGS